MKIKIKDVEVEVDDDLGKQICSLIKNSVKEPYKLIKWGTIRNEEIDKSRIQIGTQIDVGADSPFIFDVVDINNDIYTLVSHYVIADLPFDAPEPKNPNEGIRKFGSNDYLTSNIRQWLNVRFGVDFKPKTPYDVPFTNWEYISPFNLRIYATFLSKTLENSYGDKFWLLSKEDFQEIEFFGKEENRKKTDINGIPKCWWLRTSSSLNDTGVRYVDTDVSKDCNIARGGLGVVPVCQIKL